jgi:transcription antitermination factor NusG
MSLSHWSVVQTESQRERVAGEFLKAAGYAIYLPRILVKKREVPLFPGYLFVGIIDQWWGVRWSVAVVRLLMNGEGVPAVVPKGVVEGIQRREGSDGLVKLPKVRGMERGDQVRIVRGSFEGHIGLYEGMSGEARVCVLLELMGRAVPVVMARGDVAAIVRGME